MVHAADLPAPDEPSGRTETRRRVRMAIVVYGLALTALLVVAAYVAPASALDAPIGPNGPNGASQPATSPASASVTAR